MTQFSTLWRAGEPLVLASKSISRIGLLTAAGLPVEAVPASIDERALEDEARQAGADAAGVAAALALAKARQVATSRPGRLVLGADQTLALGDIAFHKPAGRAEAAAQLAELAGRTHELHAAAALVRDGDVLWQGLQTARMTMRALSPAMIALYLDAAGNAVTSTVGAYQLEALGVHLFERIEGDHFTILGLPLIELLAFLRESGSVAR